MKSKARLFSGIQPTGNLTIGNYAGAIRNWVQLQDEYESIFCLVDLHALTVDRDRDAFREKCYDFIALYIACGIDPEKSVVFVQSHNPDHTDLTWILNCITSFRELRRMTQFKEKSGKQPKNVNAGLFDYPVLMAADILLYNASLVPVGEDQKQHVELARDIAVRFNNRYGKTFTVPGVHVPATGARIKNLLDPARKMDKSNENPNTYIGLLDSANEVRQKIKAAVTGSTREYTVDDDTSGIANLLAIMSAVTGIPIEKVAGEYQGKGYAEFKRDLTDRIVEFLRPIQSVFKAIRNDETGIRNIVNEGALRARSISERTMMEVREKLGLIAGDSQEKVS